MIVTLCPGTAETYHLLNYEQFKMMKDGVYLINTSRGSVVSNDALISALKTGKVNRAGLDVVDGEPNVPEYLANNPRVTITPREFMLIASVEHPDAQMLRHTRKGPSLQANKTLSRMYERSLKMENQSHQSTGHSECIT